jgi:hypothetical protein
MPASTFRYSSSDGAQITAYRWVPAGEPRAVIQLTHGMGEHAQRYDYVARALNDAGFAVYAQDHRGHGASADPDALGDMGPGGWPALVDDIGLLSAHIRTQHPGPTYSSRPLTWTSRWTWPSSMRRSSPRAPTTTGYPATRRSSTRTSPIRTAASGSIPRPPG